MPNLKVGGGGFLAHMYAYNVFLKNFEAFTACSVGGQYFLPPT
jgi:hypothetical protein